jgi:CheY-like chemotaxis protein/glycine cleavage system H lipoate-binding protein
MNARHKLLVIEDEPSVSRAVVMVCDREGLSVTAVDNAAEALEVLERSRFSLILCDIMMQGMDGFRFLEELDRRGRPDPVVMMTGYSTMENAVKSLSMGAIDYIPKPFTADELLTVIRRSLRSSMLRETAYAAKVECDRTMGFVPSPAGYHRLGYVSWVKLEDEGTAKIGVSDLFLKSVENIREFELYAVGERLVQGVPCAVATSVDGSSHGIMCPMGGKVLEVNEDALSDAALVEKDPFFRGWLYRILPSNPDSNLKWLNS